MASYGYTFVSGDTLTPTKLNNARTVSDIVNADIKSDAAIAHSKLASITSSQVLLGNASNVPTATAVTGDVTISNTGVTAISSDVIVNADIKSDAAIAHTKLANITAGSVLMGNASNVPTATALSGDVTVTSAGVTAIGSGVIVNADINAAAAIAHTKLANITAGQVLMGNASNAPTATALSGDVTVSSSGVTAIGSGVIVDADVNASAAIALSKLATGALPTAITVTTGNMVNASVTQAKLGTNVAGNGPAFRAYAGTTTTVADSTWTKVSLNTEDYDTNSNFASSTFTPTVAGYYQINGAVSWASAFAASGIVAIYKNGAVHSRGFQVAGTTYNSSVSDIVYCNGTTDTLELWANHVSGGNRTVQAEQAGTYFSGCLVRAA